MSEEQYSSMDECTLRTLLEATLDLAERRQIRTAIRELRRKELEGYEEALASKRFRSEKSSELLENKENCPRSQEIADDQTTPNAFQLAKLEAIKDVEELTTLLRTANEYEERKLIRAAIRKLRNEEIEAISSLVSRSRERDVEKMVPREEVPAEVTSALMLERDDLEERQQIKSQIRELRAAQTKEDRKPKELASDKLLQDPPSKQLSSSTSTTSSESTEECSLNADCDLDLEVANNYRNQNSCNSHWQKSSHDSMSGEEDDGREKNEDHEVFKTEDTNGIDDGKEEDAFGESSTESTVGDKITLETMELIQKESDPNTELESITLSTVDKIEDSETLTPSVDKTATVSHTSDHPVDPSPFRRTHSLRESPKRVAEDSVDQPAFLGSRFGSQRGESRSRGNRILQQQQQLLKSSSPALKNKVSPILTNTKAWTSGRQAFDSLLQKRQETTPKKANADTPTSKYGLQRGGQSLSVRQRIIESQKQCLSETDGNSHSKAGPRDNSTADERHSTESVKGACIADTGGKHNSSQGDGAGWPNIHQLNSPRVTLAGRSKAGQSESALVTSQRGHIENSERSWKKSEVPSTLHPAAPNSLPAKQLDSDSSQDSPDPGPDKSGQLSTSDDKITEGEAVPENANHDDEMKTLFTIEIKDGRNQPATTRIIGAPGGQRAELTLGVRSTPFTVTTSSGGVVKVEAEKNELQKPVAVVPNGTEKAQVVEPQKTSKLSAEELSRIEEEDVLDKMLDKTTDFEERRLIRTAMRELRQRKRDQREKERDQRLADIKSKGTSKAARSMETTMSQSEQSADGSSVSTVTKTQRLVQSNDGNKTSRTTMVESSYMKRSEDGGTIVQTKASFSATSKKVGSIFDREDDAASRAAQERRQAERKKELMAAQSLPKTSATQARKAMIDKLEKESGSPSSPSFARVAVTPTSGFGVPNANSIKQMLLDWCKAKTRGYENVNIQNFSSSWSDGMAFCALVHNFFPEAFDFNELQPQNRRKNFDLAFSTAEKHADCPQLLDVDDMVRMREPDWKCVYTYIQEFYRCLVQKGLVKWVRHTVEALVVYFISRSKIRFLSKSRQQRMLLLTRELVDCVPLVEVEDMMIMGKKPDPKCVFTYVQSLCNHLRRYELTLQKQKEF